ncbi:MAG: OB-fold nucleic acid binding domain-containing protein [Carbonactinosporaceae bacterium]
MQTHGDDAGGTGGPRRPGRLRTALSRLASSRSELEAAELLTTTQAIGCTLIADAVDREQVTVSGTLRTVTLRPRAGVPALEAELYDGSGALEVVWLGRRQIAGIEPGRQLVAHGRITVHEGRAAIFNPRYELLPTGQD